MKKKKILKSLTLFFVLIFSLAFLMRVSMPGRMVSAQEAPFQTPTPDENGYIYHTVTEADFACWNIAEKYKTTVDEIIRLNNLDKDCTISVGKKLLVAVITATAVPATATPAPVQPTQPVQATPTDHVPANYQPEPTAMLDTGKICIVLFHDLNGNSMREGGESFLYGGEVSINDRVGTVSRVGTTVAGDPDTTTPMCFEQLPPGEYNISIAVPDGFNSTTATNHAISIVSGETLTIDFGAQEATPESIAQQEGSSINSLPLLLLGAVILLSGLGLLFYMVRSRKQ